MSMGRSARVALTAIVTATLAGVPAPAVAGAQELRWRLVTPEPPPTTATGGEECPNGEQAPCSGGPTELGRIGDIEFAAPNRGLLITAGNGSDVPPGIWEYNGTSWRELASVCGAGDGRIAWAGSEEFWTVSDERAGQPANDQGLLPPLEDNTLCHFAPNPASGALEVVRSYASPAFAASSYQAMDAAACLNPGDCWFAGEPLPAPLPGAFNLHWNGAALEADANVAAHSVQGIRAFEGRLIESVALAREEVQGKDETPLEILHPFVLYTVPAGGPPASFEGWRPFAPGHLPLPEYAAESFPAALAGMRLSTDMDAEGKESLWAAAGPASAPPQGSQPGVLTVLRYAGGVWSQVLGPESPVTLGTIPAALAEREVTAIAAEPGSESAWLGLDTQLDVATPNPTALATVVHVQADGAVSVEQLPSAAERAEGVAPQGAVADLDCPAQNDCWLATTRGTLFHLSEAADQTLPLDGDAAFAAGALITFRPQDEGLPAAASSRLAGADLEEEAVGPASAPPRRPPSSETVQVAVAPYSDARLRVLGGNTLELSFRLPVRARVRLVAQRKGRVVASTAARVLAAGRRALRLRLNPRQWPTKLTLQVHPLTPLPTVPASRALNTITTSLHAPTAAGLAHGAGILPAGLGF